jgi:hypothetical protein
MSDASIDPGVRIGSASWRQKLIKALLGKVIDRRRETFAMIMVLTLGAFLRGRGVNGKRMDAAF